MQEIILYKSRCDNRLNEIMERVSADKREAESLAKKYEEKYKQVGDVASKLTSEEATFRDIQEKKMELYQAIVKLDGSGAEKDDLQARADKVQSGLDELVKSVNERCKRYGLRAKPSSLVEIPFGWQPGIQEAAADWDETWDKFEEEGFTFVKELTLDVQNVIAPPKPKFSTVKREMPSGDDGLTASSDTVAKSENVPDSGEQIHENKFNRDESKNDSARSPPDSPAGRSPAGSQSQEFQESQSRKNIGPDGSPQAKDTHSDHGGSEPVLSGDKSFDEPSWGAFDTHYDTDSVWGNDSVSGKEMDHERRGDNSIFGSGDFGLKPIRTESPHTDNMFSGKSTSIFADSVPSTPAYNFGSSPQKFSSGFDGKSAFAFADSVPSTPAYNFGSSTQRFSDGLEGKSPFAFADSVPSTPAYNFGSSTQRFSEGSEDHSFDHFSRFDSFNMHDGGALQSPRHSLSRFDSMNSSRDFDTGHGYSTSPRSLARFDSMRSSADFDPSHGFSSSPRNSFARFDSIRGSGDFDPNHGFTSSPRDSFTRFDSFRSNKDFDPSHGFPSFDDTDPFGSTGPFRTSVESQTPKRGSDNWSAF